MKDNLHLQIPPNLWSVGYQSYFIIKKYKYRLLGAHIKVSLVITPTSPYNILSQTKTTQNGTMLEHSNTTV